MEEIGIPHARAMPDEFSRRLFARCGAELLTDEACLPLVECITLLRDASSTEWRMAANIIPPWVQTWRPLRVQCHGDLRGSNILVDSNRKLHLIGFGELRLAPIFFDVARLVLRRHPATAGVACNTTMAHDLLMLMPWR